MTSQPLNNQKKQDISGLLIFIACWIFVAPVNILLNYHRLTDIRIDMLRANQTTVPTAFFDIGYLGYMILLPLSLVMIYAIVRQLKIFLTLEVINLTLRSIFLLVYLFIMKDTSILFNILASYLFRSILISLITILYFLKSNQIQSTFVTTVDQAIRKTKSKPVQALKI